jgi:predicted TIM-barrel fold metal-dependent hydrolase
MAETSGQSRNLRLYDSHAHLVSDDLERYPRNIVPMNMEGRAKPPSKSNPFGPGTVGIPGGMHGPNPVDEKPTAEQLHQWMQEENVVAIAAVQKGMIYRTDNSYIVDAADLFPDEMRAVIIIDPREEKTLSMIRDGAERGIAGIRFFPINVTDKIAWLSSEESLKVWELANELGLIVDIEGPPTDGAALIPLIEGMADRFPNLTIVLDHIFLPTIADPDFGIGSNFDGFRARKNIYVKWTSLNMDVIREQGVAPEKVLRRAVDFFGADKVMWGSDIGTSSGTYKEMVQRAIDSTALLNDEERAKILHDTGRRVFGG